MCHYRPRCIDLFCGAGGMSLGFEEAGCDIVAGVELDPVHAFVHRYNFPDCTVFREDISELAGEQIEAQVGPVDIVIGGPPCQGFSMIGKRDEGDVRNGLVMQYMRIVSELQPRYFVMENVSGLTVGYGKQFLEQAIQYIERCGYHIVRPYKVLDASHYGVPQKRKRLFLLGYRDGEVAPSYPSEDPIAVTVGDAIMDLPDIDTFDALIDNDTVEFIYHPESSYSRRLHHPVEIADDYSYPRVWDDTVLTGSMRTDHTEESRRRFHNTSCGEVEPKSRFHKLSYDGQCNTLRAGTDKSRGAYTSPRPIHPRYDRCISVREAERLHSFPDWFRMHKTKWHGFREVGNSVPPLLAKAVASQIITAMGIVPIHPRTSMQLGDESYLSFSVTQAEQQEAMI